MEGECGGWREYTLMDIKELDLFIHNPTQEELDSVIGTVGRGRHLGQELWVEYITAPRWNGDMWVCLANIHGMLCSVEVKLKEESKHAQ